MIDQLIVLFMLLGIVAIALILYAEGALTEVARCALYAILRQDAYWAWWAIGSGATFAIIVLTTLLKKEPDERDQSH